MAYGDPAPGREIRISAFLTAIAQWIVPWLVLNQIAGLRYAEFILWGMQIAFAVATLGLVVVSFMIDKWATAKLILLIPAVLILPVGEYAFYHACSSQAGACE